MKVALVDFSQRTSLEDGATSNFITFALPNGVQFEAMVTEETLKNIIAARWAHKETQTVEEAPTSLPFDEDKQAGIFGGDYTPTEAPPREERVERRPQVAMDDYGNPIVNPVYTAPNGTAYTPESADEDGIGQL